MSSFKEQFLHKTAHDDFNIENIKKERFDKFTKNHFELHNSFAGGGA